MTAAQKTAKAKFKQAIAYRQKTGVSLKEAFAHIYGKKVGAVNKKAAKKVVRKIVKKKTVPKKKAAKKKSVYGIGNSYIFKVYDRDTYGNIISDSFRKVTISASSQSNAKDKLYKRFPSSKYFFELQDSYTNKVSGVRSTIKKAIRFTKGAKNQIKRGISKSIKNTKKYFNINTKNDLLLKRIKESVSDLVTYENTINNYMSYPIKERNKYMSSANINHVKKLIKETKTHIKELKKSL